MSQVMGSQIVQFLVLGAAMIAFILAAKAGASRLPSGGIAGAIKTAVLAV